MSIIQDLWYGNVCGVDDCSANKSSSYEVTARCIQTTLENMLDAEQKKAFSAYVDAIHNAALDWQENAFTYGFSLGHRLALEAQNSDTK